MKKTEAYQILSDLIFKGFITVAATIGNKHMILKTVNDREFDMIKFRSGTDKGPEYITRFNTFFLAYSVFMVDGYNMLQDREENIRTLQEFFCKVPIKFYEKIISETSIIRDKSYDSLKFLEGYTYTDSARWKWKALNGAFPNSTVFTGIPGSSDLGINAHQENWVHINRMVDDFDSNSREFETAVLIASASNPKGAKQIRSRHDSNTQNVEDRRKKLAHEGYIDVDTWSPEGWAAPVDTAEELVAELERQISGVKDKHDVFMENYLKSMNDQAEAQSRQAEERLKKMSEEGNQALITGSQRALTTKEAKALFSSPSEKSHVISVLSDEQSTVEGKEKYMSKIGSKVLTGKK